MDAHKLHQNAMDSLLLGSCIPSGALQTGCLHYAWDARREAQLCFVDYMVIRPETFCRGIVAVAQSKTISELDAELALPLVANSALAFLRRHLALGTGQVGPLDESMQANSKRLETIENRIASQATLKVSTLCPS